MLDQIIMAVKPLPEVNIETSGMTTELEASAKEVTLHMYKQDIDTQDAKAKFIVKEMERRNGNDWACMVEPTSKFIQCFGVTKRPDQYIRLTCGPDRVRIWRITDMEL